MVDLIICDWKMPRMSGLELLCQVETKRLALASGMEQSVVFSD